MTINESESMTNESKVMDRESKSATSESLAATNKEKNMSNDWMPGTRTAMCRNWLAYMTADLRALWGVPDAEWSLLGTLFSAAEGLLQKAQDEAASKARRGDSFGFNPVRD